MPYHSSMEKNSPMGVAKTLTTKQMDRLKEHAKAHKGGMRGKHMRNMVKFMKAGDTFSTAHTKAMKLDKDKSKPKMGEAKIDGERIPFRIGALHSQLKTPKGYKFTKTELNRLKNINNGKKFDFLGNNFTMTDKLKKRINFGLVLMKGSK